MLSIVEDNTTEVVLRSTFVFLGTGFYDYNEPLQSRISGLEDFEGEVIHPQFWPDDLDYGNKNVVIIGSGATAITLLPSMVESTASTTLLQRSPSYVLSVPGEDLFDKAVKLLLPKTTSSEILRIKWTIFAFVLTTFCTWFPNLAKRLVLLRTRMSLPSRVTFDPHFIPAYNPWEQRMGLCPKNEFFKAFENDKAHIVTGVIDTVKAKSIRLQSGDELHADILITATGLKLQFSGGVSISVNGNIVNIPNRFVWKGTMLESVPNLFFAMGYVDASWTLGVDVAAQIFCRLLKYTRATRYSCFTPKLDSKEKVNMTELPFLNLTSTYIKRAQHLFPKVGTSAQWRPRSYYWKELASARWGDITTGLEWYCTSEIKRSAASSSDEEPSVASSNSE